MSFDRAWGRALNIVELQTAEQFISYFRPSNAMWWDASAAKHTHYFRGHANVDWKLLPKGLRPLDANNPLTPLYRAFEAQFETTGIQLLEDQLPEFRQEWLLPFLCWQYALNEAVNQFCNLGRQIGLETPWFVHPSNIGNHVPKYWPHQQHEEGLLALAQHHRIPTVLLDWSEDPLAAAYFAVGTDEQTDLCVWALPANISEYRVDSELRILVEKPPTAGNTNIRAQNGVFVKYYGHQTKPSKVFDGREWLPFECHDAFSAGLSKVTLPAAERDELRRLLLAERRSAAHLMPSWDSVAETLLSRWERSSRRPPYG